MEQTRLEGGSAGAYLLIEQNLVIGLSHHQNPTALASLALQKILKPICTCRHVSHNSAPCPVGKKIPENRPTDPPNRSIRHMMHRPRNRLPDWVT
ncbi:hypothetical protein BC938DRAFT_481502 [Jimgerdemannia flammicorona]|uniref:Uncharacterized protein n=1 Tax=Jimgerdemannia flammicorona TaxID=994334 RepID=A0A433QG54_9FUNG|nr:hypothetical protein BC938DRAFT_481502 [Jimgerdemannia flammicorona]